MGRRITELFYELRATPRGCSGPQRQRAPAREVRGVRPGESDRGVGAFGVALAGVGIEAAHMAEQVDARSAGSR
jgi:hypothetical protein